MSGEKRAQVCICGDPLISHWQTGKRLCMACPEGACPDFTPAPSPAAEPPDGLREAVARWLRGRYAVTPDESLSEADALLAGPLADVLRERDELRAAVERVEALVLKWRDGRLPDQGRAFDLRRALDGDR